MNKFGYFIAAALMTAVLAGCSTRIEPYNRNGNHNQGTPQQPTEKELVLTENSTWKISREERKIIDDAAYVEQMILVNNVPLTQRYLVSVINKANFQSYEGDVAAFLKNELEYNSNYIYEGSPEVISFGRLRHGTWYAFIIAIDKNKELTGEYAYCKFNVEEEEPTPEYQAWLGFWTVSDGSASYDITISQEESNQVYRIDGWEIRPNVEDWEQMDQESLEAFFEPSDGRLYFASQYLTTYKDESLNGVEVDELFIGQIDFDEVVDGIPMGLYIVPDMNMDLAYAVLDAEDKARVYPCDVEVSMDDTHKFTGKFHCMQYAYQEVQSGNWHLYNKDVLAFFDGAGSLKPMTMTLNSKGVAEKPSSIKRRSGTPVLSTEEKPLRARVYQPRSEQKAKGVVRAK